MYTRPNKDKNLELLTSMTLNYKNGDETLSLSISYMDGSVGFGIATNVQDIRLEKIEINGYEAVIFGEMLTVEIEDVICIFRSSNLEIDELFKMAESLR